jgi:hypothetical protein
MSEKKQTTPQGEEIPVPKRGAFMRDLKKVAKGQRPKPKRSTPSRPKK